MEFFMNFDEGNIAFWSYLPWWIMIPALLLIGFLLFRWGRWAAIKNNAFRFRKKYFKSRYMAFNDQFDVREINALKSLGQGYMVVDLLDDPNKGSNARKAPLTLWKINDTRHGGHIIATPIPGYLPTRGEAVHLMTWTTERFDRKTPLFMYFIEPVKKEAPQA